jgi:NAD(P)-dependent dehydrogenase (short-subunit alcohol dehydrogenase family)/acyl carrier protein
MHVSLGLLRTGGRFIEVGKKDIAEDNGLPMRAFNRNLTFASVDVDRLSKERPDLMSATLRKIVDHFAAGDFGQAEVTTFGAKKVRDAFELVARSRHVGKVLLDFESGAVEARESAADAPVIRRDGSYLITGGTSGFGLATARWMAGRGAGRLILASRSGAAAAGMDAVVAELEAAGSAVDVWSVDVADAAAVGELVARAGTDALPLRGVVHGAMVLDDGMMAGLTPERFGRVFAPKATGALNLAAALGAGEGLDFLVFDSSVSAIVGNPGQTSYVVANALLDALARKLRAGGVPAVSINWGALAESGVVARDGRLGNVLTASGIAGLTDAEAFAAMERAIRSGRAQVGVFKVDWKRWALVNPRRAEDSRFRGLVRRAQDGEGGDAASAMRLSLEDVATERRVLALEDHLREVLANVLKMSKDAVPVNRKLNEIGVDSLMVLELGLGIRERIGVEFSAMEILKGPTLKKLSELAVDRLWRN